MYNSLKKIFRHTLSLCVWILSTVLAFVLWYSYSNIDYVAGNYQSYFFAYYDVLLSFLMILCFPIILAAITYKSLIFGKKNLSKVSSFGGIVSGVISAFITGCVCCGVSLLSVLGLSSIIAFLEILPYDGIEVKTLAILLLLYSTYDTLKNLEVCKIKR